ncbi:ABC transporter ATP-binding protein [Anaerocolumna sp. MB42-C2]|uniref:ABC transporter ATP-binding protein n=1 Tax=Anaerocolumna sp. MB42-C2 TaxID=3070997 RepID=UPI0027E08645|nr:ABC transporter ATP-binding protein [Anaerocolumna sp. MB42-C2]WMJ86468.1 ABC transporter ATP-binding protein [Anaerocolumna sp. MB42-C2]
MRKISIRNKKYTYCHSVKITFISSPKLAGIYLLLTIIAAILPTLQVIVNADFLDSALDLLNGSATKSHVYQLLGLVILFVSYLWIMEPIMTAMSKSMEQDLRLHFRNAVMEKRAKLKFCYIEDQESLDLIERVTDNAETKMIQGYTNLLELVSLVINTTGLLVILIAEVAWVALFIIIVAIPLFYLAFLSGKSTYEANKDITKYQRKYKYLTKIMTERDAIEERTLFGYNNELNRVWNDQYEIARKKELKTRSKWFIKLKTGSVITAFISIFISAVLVKPAVTGAITIGMLFSLINAALNLVHTMSWQMTRCIDSVASHNEYLKELTRFSWMEEEEGADALPGEIPEFDSLKFINVRFKYPGTDRYILNGINLELEKGKHYAFVGVNGAGKTTIAKLLTGLYSDYEGQILINGKELRTYTKNKLKAFFSVVYQDFAKYFISVFDNIALGNVLNQDEESIKKAIKSLKLEQVIDALPSGVDSILGKIKEEGKDISGGEWQRIALARAFVSNAPIRILDEPTAALDPIAESNLYEEFAQLCEGKTTIFFSHRLGSIKLSDYIYVINGGYVYEKGTHKELMRLNGIYQTMYESQRGWYQ